jgi:hypothetical protein
MNFAYFAWLTWCFAPIGFLWNWLKRGTDPMPETPTQRCNRSRGHVRSFVWVRRLFNYRSSPRWGRERWRSIT